MNSILAPENRPVKDSDTPLPAHAAADAAPRFQIGGITINAAPGQSPADIARAVRRELAEAARQRGFALHDGGAA